MIAGACLCGTLRYEIEGSVGDLVHCHCSMCRKHHGAPFATFASVPADRLRWISGESSVIAYQSSANRVRNFCGTCGAVAPASLGDRVVVPAGNLLGDLGFPGGLHQFVASQPHVEGAVHGACLCGAVSFSVRGAPARWYQCHCSRCRRCRSAVHGSNTFYPANQFEWRSGQELVATYRPPDAERFAVSFCTRCGGGAPVEREGVPFVLVPAGLLDADLVGRPDGHIHMASKALWYTFDDGLPQFAELPPA